MGASAGEPHRVWFLRHGQDPAAESLGQQAIDEGLSVSWLSLEELGAIVRQHRIDDCVNKAVTRVTSVALICIA